MLMCCREREVKREDKKILRKIGRGEVTFRFDFDGKQQAATSPFENLRNEGWLESKSTGGSIF